MMEVFIRLPCNTQQPDIVAGKNESLSCCGCSMSMSRGSQANNRVLAWKKESRRRNLFFSLPAAFPLSPHIRMVEDDVSYISLHQVYEDFCNRSGVHKDQAIDFYVKSVEEAMAMRTV
jgi:hypothetical protein